MRDNDEGNRIKEADAGAEPTALRIGDHTVPAEDVARLDRLGEALQTMEGGREEETEALVDDDPVVEDDTAEEHDEADDLEQKEAIDTSVEPVGRVGNVQSIIDAPRTQEGDKPPSAQLSHQTKSTMHIGSGEHTYSQEVSDAARAEGLGWMSVGNVPASRDDGRGAIGAFEAAAKRHEERTDAEKAKGLVICEVDTDHGHRSQQILEHAKAKSPDLYADPGFKVVVTARDQARLDHLEQSGAFADHPGKVSFELFDPAKPRLPDGTLLALAPEVNYMPTTRLYRSPHDIVDRKTDETIVEAGEIAAATERTVIRGDSPVVTPDADDGDLPRAHWPQAFDKFYTASSPTARAEFEPALRGRVSVEFKPDAPENTDEGWRNRDIERFMDGCPPGTTIKSWQPGVTDTVANLSRQAELVYVDGNFRYGNEKLPWPQMSRREGQLWRHTTHAELVTQGAERAGARAYVPQRDNGKFNHILIDRSVDDEARAAARDAFDDVVSAEGADTTARLVAGAEKRLAEEKQRLSDEQQESSTTTEAVPAADAIERAYNRYLQARPDAVVDHELALALAQRFYNYGQYDHAIRFSERAVQAAPQMAANAHNLRAQSHIMGEQFDEAGRAIAAALAISPHDPKLYRTQAAIAIRQRDDHAHAEARINEQRYATNRLEDESRRLLVGWSAVSRAMARESEAAVGNGATEPVAVMYTRRDADTGDVRAGTAMSRRPIAQSAVLRNQAIAMATASALSVEQAYASQGPQAQGEAVELFDRIIDGIAWRRDPNDPDSETIPPHELAPVDLQLIGTAAMQAAERVQDSELATIQDQPVAPYSAVRERSPYAAEDIAVGHRINERGDSLGPYTIPLKTFNKPVIVEGATGTGKTTTVSNIALQLGAEGVPWLIIDAGPSPSYGGLPERAAQRGLDVFYWDPTKDDVGTPTLNLMAPIRGSDPQQHLESLMPWVQTISNGGEPLPQLVGEAAYNIFAEAGYDVYTERGYPNLHVLANPDAPSLHDFADNVVKRAVESGYSRAAGDVQAFAERRVLEIKRMERMLGDARPVDWDWLFNNNVVVDLSNMTPGMKQAYAAGLQTLYGEYLKTRFGEYGGANIGLQHVTMVEEGHHLYGIPDNAEAAAQQEAARMWAERTTAYRKLGEGTVIITQAPNRIISQVMENADLVIAHRTPATATRKPVADAMGFDEDARDWTKMRDLQDGQAMVTQTGVPRQLVRMAEPDDLVRENEPAKVNTASSRPPAHAIHGGRRPSDGSEPYSNNELKEAYREARSPERASWVVWGTQLALAEMTGEKLGAPPQVMQRQWSEMDARQRECLLDEVIEIVVGERQQVLREFFSPTELKTALKTTQTGMLNGQPLAGKRPGTKFLVPPLVGVHELEQRKQPFGEPTPNPRARAWPIRVPLQGVNVQTGHPNAGNIPTPRTVREQVKLLERSPISTVGDDKDHTRNRQVAWVALLGANGGRTFLDALGHFAKGRKGDDSAELFARVRHAEVAMGLIREGEPRPGPLTQYISLANRFLKKAA